MLEIQAILPINNASSIPIDQKIVISFNSEIDPNTISSGIALFTDSEGIWTGPEAGVLDTIYKDVLDVANDYTYFQYNFSIEGTTLTLTPLASLLPNRKFYLAVYPGNDPSRYVSKKTTSDPVYTRVEASVGVLEIMSYYQGQENDTFIFSFTSEDTADVSLQSGQYIGQITFPENEVVDIGLIKISRIGNFTLNDTVEIDCYKSEGLSALYQTSFTTSAYSTFVPTSKRITNLTDIETLGDTSLRLISSIPENLSFNNKSINPITLKFNKTINNQELTDKIKITRTDINSGIKKQIKFYFKINGDTVKLYLVNAAT